MEARSYRIRRTGFAAFWLLTVALASPAHPAGGGRDSAGAASIELRLPADIVYRHGNAADSAVLFSHSTHVALERNRCTRCHPRPFPMLARGPVPRHADMAAGRSCGLCHDGRSAFGVRDSASCRACHSGASPLRMAAARAGARESAAAAGRRAPGPHAYPASGASPGRVTFRHATHLRGAAGCAACHPGPFRMAPVAPLPGGGMHARAACGACHDGRRAFATDDPEACARCHAGAGGAR